MATDQRTIVDVMADTLGACIDHPHEQVDRCVWCKPCGRRLYQGEVMTADEIATLHEAIEWQRQKREAEPTPDAAGIFGLDW